MSFLKLLALINFTLMLVSLYFSYSIVIHRIIPDTFLVNSKSPFTLLLLQYLINFIHKLKDLTEVRLFCCLVELEGKTTDLLKYMALMQVAGVQITLQNTAQETNSVFRRLRGRHQRAVLVIFLFYFYDNVK